MAAPLSRSFDALAFHARFRPHAPGCADLATGEKLTFAELSARVSACAAAIRERIGPAVGERVAIISRNSAAMAIVSAACERIGAIFAPLNWRLTAAEVADLLRDCEPALVLTQPEFADTAREAIAESKTSAQLADPAELAAPAKPRKAKLQPAPLSAPCLLLYTSGTTGRAKGVIISRENAIFAALNFAALASLDTRSVLLCDAPMFHTVGLCAITRTAFQQGACVLFSDRFIPGQTLKRISDPQLGVTHYFVVPQMVEALVNDPSYTAADLSRLTAFFSGGGPLSPTLVAACQQRCVLLINGYGMSEVGSAIHLPLSQDYVSANSHAIGFPAPYIEARIASADGAPLKSGEIGEIQLRGPTISPGYWRQPEATAASRDGQWFRTGDLGRQQEDGAFVIVDRLKDMYISGGENVYPAEVELVLRQADHVTDAAVIGVPDPRWGEVGCAFIQLEPSADAAFAEQAIRGDITARLARYKQPAHFRFVDAIPRTGSGKVRKNLLRDQFLAERLSA